LQTDISAIGDLSIFCRFTGQKHERAWASDNNRSQWSAAHCLAVCAVANGRGFGISFGLERHMAAVAEVRRTSMSDLKGKVAVVTGASKGIGAAIAKGLSAAGAAVVVNYSSSKEGADRVVRAMSPAA
jgi:3-oxoacyl-ACP reductase-like protein